MKLRTIVCAATLSITALAANAGLVLLQSFALYNHPDGQVAPQAYGLRLDGFGGESPVTFSFEDGGGNSQVMLRVFDNNGQTQVRISGVLHGNSANGGTDFGTFMLNITYDVDVVGNGWDDHNTTDGGLLGGITALNPTVDSPLLIGETQDLFSITDGSGSFRFLQDGFRIDGDSTTWVGRGWVSPDGLRGATNDFLFTGVSVVPLPPAALAGLGMLACVGAYRGIRR